MYRLRALVLIFVAGILFIIKACSKWALPNQEHLIRQYYRATEPDWRRVLPPTASSISPDDEIRMPPWYGNTSEVGGSPYDFIPRALQPRERKIRILFLLDFPDYLERMNSHSYEM